MSGILRLVRHLYSPRLLPYTNTVAGAVFFTLGDGLVQKVVEKRRMFTTTNDHQENDWQWGRVGRCHLRGKLYLRESWTPFPFRDLSPGRRRPRLPRLILVSSPGAAGSRHRSSGHRPKVGHRVGARSALGRRRLPPGGRHSGQGVGGECGQRPRQLSLSGGHGGLSLPAGAVDQLPLRADGLSDALRGVCSAGVRLRLYLLALQGRI